MRGRTIKNYLVQMHEVAKVQGGGAVERARTEPVMRGKRARYRTNKDSEARFNTHFPGDIRIVANKGRLGLQP